MAQWHHIRFACGRPWVQILACAFALRAGKKKIGKIMVSFSELVCLAPDTRSVGNDEGYPLAASVICVDAASQQ